MIMHTRLFDSPSLMVQIVMACFLFALPLRAQPSPEKGLGSVPAEWPGVHFELSRIARLDAEHILVAIRIRGDASAKNPTLICHANNATAEHPDDIIPYTLTGATLTDQETGKEYPAEGGLPGSPFWGEPDIIANIRPNTWFQLAVKFKAPPPLPSGSDGKPREQKVTFHLPKATKAMKDVLLPQPGAKE